MIHGIVAGGLLVATPPPETLDPPEPIALVNRTTSASVTDGTAITWQAEQYDNESVIAVSATSMTVPSAGLYRAMCGVFTSGGATGAALRVNGASPQGQYANMTNNQGPRIVSGHSAILSLSASDAVAFYALGGTTNYGEGNSSYTWFCLERLDSDIRYCLVRKSADQSIANQNVSYDTEVADVGDWHDTVTNNDRLTVPAGSGITRVRLSANIQMSGGTGAYVYEIRKNGSSGVIGLPNRRRGTDIVHMNFCSPPINVAEGDFFAMNIQGSGITAKSGTNTWFQIEEVPSDIKSCLVYNSGSFPSINNTDQVMTWNSEDHDPDGMHSTVSNTGRLTVPAGCSWARVYFQINNGAAGRVWAQLTKNGGGLTSAIGKAIDSGPDGPGSVTGASAWIAVVPGDYFELLATCEFSGTLTGGWFAMECF